MFLVDFKLAILLFIMILKYSISYKFNILVIFNCTLTVKCSKTLCMTSIVLNCWDLFYKQNIIYHGKCCIWTWKVFVTTVLWNVLWMSIVSIWLIMLFKCSIFLLIFCLLVLSIIHRIVLKSATIVLNVSISPCSSISFLLHVF